MSRGFMFADCVYLLPWFFVHEQRNELASNGAAQKRSSNHHVRRCQDLHVGSMGSETSGVTTSDSESEDDLQGRGGR